MKKIVIIALLLSSKIGFSQELVSEIKLNLGKSRDIYQIVDESKKEVYFFCSDKVKTTAYRLNSVLQVIDSISTARPKEKNSAIIGYTQSESAQNLIWSTGNGSDVLVQTYDFFKKTIKTKALNLDYKKERFLQKISANGLFYILSLIEDSNILKIKIIDKNGNLDVRTIDTSTYTLVDKYGEVASLYAIFDKVIYPLEDRFSLKQITNDTPNSLTFAAYKRKIYAYPNELVLSFDNNIKFTQLYKINLTDFSISRTTIEQPTTNFQNVKDTYDPEDMTDKLPEINSNSFIIDDKILQIRLSAELVTVSIKNLNGVEIKSFTTKYNEPIAFKNTEIIQESGSVNSIKVLESSNQFIRKLYNSNPAITCFEKDGSYYATIGSATGIVYGQTGAALAGGMFGVVGSLIAVALSSNVNIQNYDSYQNRKIVYFSSLFDKNFNHISGEMKTLPYEQLRKFAFSKSDDTDFTIFKFKNELYFGSYKIKSKAYSFYKFVQ